MSNHTTIRGPIIPKDWAKRNAPNRGNYHRHQPFGYSGTFGLEGKCGRCHQEIFRIELDSEWRTHIVIIEWP